MGADFLTLLQERQFEKLDPYFAIKIIFMAPECSLSCWSDKVENQPYT